MPKVESMDANFVTINPEVARTVIWHNMALNQERLSRFAIKVLVFSGLGVTLISLLFLAGSYMLAGIISPQLDKARQVTTQATNQLLIDATAAQHSNVSQHLSRIIELNNVIGSFGGVLEKYEVKDGGGVMWEALIPSAVAPKQLQATAIGAEKGRIRIQGTN